MKAKKVGTGIWKYGEFHNSAQINNQLPTPLLHYGKTEPIFTRSQLLGDIIWQDTQTHMLIL